MIKKIIFFIFLVALMYNISINVIEKEMKKVEIISVR